jgi:hypothetical protein
MDRIPTAGASADEVNPQQVLRRREANVTFVIGLLLCRWGWTDADYAPSEGCCARGVSLLLVGLRWSQASSLLAIRTM